MKLLARPDEATPITSWQQYVGPALPTSPAFPTCSTCATRMPLSPFGMGGALVETSVRMGNVDPGRVCYACSRGRPTTLYVGVKFTLPYCVPQKLYKKKK